VVKERKNSSELDLPISKKTTAPVTYVPRSKTVTAVYIHKAIAKIFSGLKDKACLYRSIGRPIQGIYKSLSDI
jgi:hypothetical protein